MFCPNCGKDAGTAKFCPECGTPITQASVTPETPPIINQTPPPKPKKKTGCLIAFLLFFIFIGFGIGSIPDSAHSSGSGSGSSTTQQTPKLEVLDHSTVSDGYVRYVSGHIKNNTNKTYSYVQVSINLYDDGTLVGSTLDNVNNLEPGATWEFKAVILQDNADQYKITEVTGW